MSTATLAPRTALFLPASNARAIEKVRGLAVDMVLLDLEDAVKAEDKAAARSAAVAAAGTLGKPSAIRSNAADSPEYSDDLAAIHGSTADYLVIPKVETGAVVADAFARTGKPVFAMIETPLAILRLPEIAGAKGIAGLIAGTNDLRAELKLPTGADRSALSMALQSMVLAGRAHGLVLLDGVFNGLDNPQALASECAEGRALGFDGKTLIHPNQIDIAARAFAPSEAEVEDARALIAAAKGGAERFRDRMIEAMHVAQAEALLARA